MKEKKYFLLLALVSLFLLVNIVQKTYAKYVSSAEANANFSVAQWGFKVNNQDVIANNNFSGTIIPVFENNPNVKNGVIAPTSEGYFDIIIDSTNVDVSFTEKIELSKEENNTVSDLVITHYTVNDGDMVELTDNTITAIHNLNDTNKVNTYRVYIKWIDGGNETMNNEADTKASKDGIAAVSIKLSFIQNPNN